MAQAKKVGPGGGAAVTGAVVVVLALVMHMHAWPVVCVCAVAQNLRPIEIGTLQRFSLQSASTLTSSHHVLRNCHQMHATQPTLRRARNHTRFVTWDPWWPTCTGRCCTAGASSTPPLPVRADDEVDVCG